MTAESSDRAVRPDPIAELLEQREVDALKLLTITRFVLMAVMIPTVWWLGQSASDQNMTLALCAVYAFVAIFIAYLTHTNKHLKIAGFIGVALDVLMVGLLPLIWYASMGGDEVPVGITLKTSVTLVAVLLITLNALMIRPIYPMLVTIGALLVHFALVAGSVLDPDTVFTQSYTRAYTTAEIATGKIITGILVVGLVGMIVTLLTTRARKMVTEAAELQKKNVQLGRYFSDNLVKKLSESPELLEVGGERREISIVITDLEGFTSFVESNESSVVVPLLNGYLDELINVAFDHDGTVDKIVGDSVIVIFGAPVTQPDHPDRAIACALEMDSVAQRYRAKIPSSINFGVTRIGVNSGFAIVGNFGSDALYDYTAYGDAVNTAARLEGANKYLGTRVCVSAAAASRVAGFQGRPVGTLLLKGKTTGIDVFEPVATTDGESSSLADYLEIHDLLRLEHPGALERLAEHCTRYPKDALATFHLNRLRAGQSGTQIELAGK